MFDFKSTLLMIHQKGADFPVKKDIFSASRDGWSIILNLLKAGINVLYNDQKQYHGKTWW
jgi:hypothetical protein